LASSDQIWSDVESEPLSSAGDDAELAPELVDAVVVVEHSGAVEPIRVGPPPFVAAAAAAATGFVAGAATAIVLSRRRETRRLLGPVARRRLPSSSAARRLPPPQAGPAQTFLVYVQPLGRRP
jgi:hypothetical protein